MALNWRGGQRGLLVAIIARPAAQTTPREVALKYAVEHAESLGVKPTDMTNLAVTSEYRSAHNQVTHVNLGQRRNGLEVFTGHVTINVNRESRVVFAGGSLVRGINDPVAGAELDAVEAVEAAAATVSARW